MSSLGLSGTFNGCTSTLITWLLVRALAKLSSTIRSESTLCNSGSGSGPVGIGGFDGSLGSTGSSGPGSTGSTDPTNFRGITPYCTVLVQTQSIIRMSEHCRHDGKHKKRRSFLLFRYQRGGHRMDSNHRLEYSTAPLCRNLFSVPTSTLPVSRFARSYYWASGKNTVSRL
jgi:hypothetical protein